MRRKLIKQGNHALTVTLPVKWLKAHHLEAGNEIDIHEDTNALIIQPTERKKEYKITTITLADEPFDMYRSLIGGYYRGGYDEIKVQFDDLKILPTLQKAVDSLYGYELFNIDQKSCVIKSIYETETIDLKAHVMRMIHTVKTMQTILLEDIEKHTYRSKEEIQEFRNSIIKQRDLIVRTIVQQKLLENKQFPYLMIAYSLWNAARNYNILYKELEGKYTKKNVEYFKSTITFFDHIFQRLTQEKTTVKHKEYDELRKRGFKLMKNKAEASILVAFCINIIMAIQSADSAIITLKS